MGNTANFNLEYPDGSDDVDIAQHIQNLAEDVDSALTDVEAPPIPIFPTSIGSGQWIFPVGPGSNSNQGINTIRLFPMFLPAMTIQSMAVRHMGNSGNGTAKFKSCVYTMHHGRPKSLIAEASTLIPVYTTPAWVTLTPSSPVVIDAGWYYVGGGYNQQVSIQIISPSTSYTYHPVIVNNSEMVSGSAGWPLYQTFTQSIATWDNPLTGNYDDISATVTRNTATVGTILTGLRAS